MERSVLGDFAFAATRHKEPGREEKKESNHIPVGGLPDHIGAVWKDNGNRTLVTDGALECPGRVWKVGSNEDRSVRIARSALRIVGQRRDEPRGGVNARRGRGLG